MARAAHSRRQPKKIQPMQAKKLLSLAKAGTCADNLRKFDNYAGQ
jgi:hypothetical protein